MSPNHRSARGRLARAACLGLLLVSGCATEVHSSGDPISASARRPRPVRVLVAEFAVVPDAVMQDQGIGARLQREMSGDDQSEAQAAIARDVQTALSTALRQALAGAGLPAEAAAGETPRAGDLLVEGRIERIDQGNRTRRLAIGFGAGKSVVAADAQLYYVAPDGRPMLMQTYEGKSDSGRKPGVAAGAGGALSGGGPAAGAVSTLAGVSAETGRSPVAREGAQYGRRLAHEIGVLAARQGWIGDAAVPSLLPF